MFYTLAKISATLFLDVTDTPGYNVQQQLKNQRAISFSACHVLCYSKNHGRIETCAILEYDTRVCTTDTSGNRSQQ
jgi:hypothetical protein